MITGTVGGVSPIWLMNFISIRHGTPANRSNEPGIISTDVATPIPALQSAESSGARIAAKFLVSEAIRASC